MLWLKHTLLTIYETKLVFPFKIPQGLADKHRAGRQAQGRQAQVWQTSTGSTGMQGVVGPAPLANRHDVSPEHYLQGAELGKIRECTALDG